MRWFRYKNRVSMSAGNEYITVDEVAAAAWFRRHSAQHELSDFAAIEGFISSRNAVEVRAPMDDVEPSVSEHMMAFVARRGSVSKAGKELNLHPNVVKALMDGTRKTTPVYVLKRIGLKQVIRLVKDE